MKQSLIIILGLAFLSTSCEKVFLKPNPNTDPLSIFNEYATLVQEKHAMLAPKNINIIQLRDSIRGTITGQENDKELFLKLATITHRLKDGHSVLSSDKYFHTYNITQGYPIGGDRNILNNNYINETASPNLSIDIDGEKIEGTNIQLLKIAYGPILNHNNIGYIRIPSFNVPIEDNTLSEAFKSIANTEGLIMDVRGNGGGDPSLAIKVASFLIDQALYIGDEKFKTGPGEHDFSTSHVNINPTQNSNKYLKKPIIVLTDRGCFSATTTFCYAVDPIQNVTFMGQRTGGGSGSLSDGFLANGWHWSLSTSEFIDLKGRHLDNGFEPDISVAFDPNNTSKDEVLEKAIEVLSTKQSTN